MSRISVYLSDSKLILVLFFNSFTIDSGNTFKRSAFLKTSGYTLTPCVRILMNSGSLDATACLAYS